MGRTFKDLTVLGDSGKRIRKQIIWTCLCSCGKIKEISSHRLLSGNVGSCGCKKGVYIREYRRKRFGESGFNRLLKKYKDGATQRGYTWELTDEEAKYLFQGVCSYCGIIPSQKSMYDETTYGIFYYNGIDRVTNSIGYTVENSVSCCKTCNMAKHAMSEQEFLAWITRVYNYRIAKL